MTRAERSQALIAVRPFPKLRLSHHLQSPIWLIKKPLILTIELRPSSRAHILRDKSLDAVDLGIQIVNVRTNRNGLPLDGLLRPRWCSRC